MTTTIDIEKFVASYKATFATFDPKAITDFYNVPFLGLNSEEVIAFLTREDLVEHFVKVTNGFRSAGITRFHYEIGNVEQLSSAVIHLPIRWWIYGKDDVLLKTLNNIYVLWGTSNPRITAVHTLE